MVLPADRPIATADIHPALGLPARGQRGAALHGTLEAAWLLGLNPAAWSAVMRDARSASPALLRSSQAIFLRWLQAYPNAGLHHLGVASPLELLRALEQAAMKPLLRELSVALGCEASAASRWIRSSDQADPIVCRICAALLGTGAVEGVSLR